MLFNIKEEKWDDELLALFDIPRSMLPEVKESSALFGETTTTIFAHKIPITGVAGDQHAALFGQMCVDKAMVKNTYGTGCFMLMNIGDKFIASKNNLLTTIAWKINGKTQYAFEGSIFIGGAVVQWLRDGLKVIQTSEAVEDLALSEKDNGGVYFVPAFAGLGAPYWNQDAQGTIVGLSRGSTAGHIARAALQAIAFQSMDVLSAMEADANIKIKELRVDGGASANNLLMQFQSNLLNCNVVRPTTIETTALGVTYLAGLQVGFWKDIEEIRNKWQIDQTFNPKYDEGKIAIEKENWKKAIKSTQSWTVEQSKV
jgi:glycerol kinase